MNGAGPRCVATPWLRTTAPCGVQLVNAPGTGTGTTLAGCASGNRVGARLANDALHVDGEPAAAARALDKAAGLVRLEATVQAKRKGCDHAGAPMPPHRPRVRPAR